VERVKQYRRQSASLRTRAELALLMESGSALSTEPSAFASAPPGWLLRLGAGWSV
jgi:hypothetical protein